MGGLGGRRYPGAMRTTDAVETDASFGPLLEAARRAPVTVTENGRPSAAVVSIAHYQRLRRAAWDRLFEAMAVAQRQAAERGLTDELLEELLADES